MTRMTRITRIEVLLRAFLLLAVCDAARLARSTTPATSTSATFEPRQLGFPGQPEDVPSMWEHMDLQKLDTTRADTWKSATVQDIARGSDNDTTIVSAGRQFYPGYPQNTGETGEIPSPILPPIILPQPSPAPGCLGLRGQYPSPTSCANYLNCWDDVVVEQTCPGGLLFNDYTNVCDFDYNVNCGNRPPPTPKPPLPPGSKTCPDPNGRYRSSTNCSEFYVCVSGRPVKFRCPRGLVYNDILDVCDYVYNVDCKGTATPRPPRPTSPTSHPTHFVETTLAPEVPQTYPSPQPPYVSPSYPTQPPYQPPYQPSYPAPQPTYPPQQPTYPSQQPAYPSQQPTYPAQQPAYPSQQPNYPGNPWLNSKDTDPWHQRPVASQLEVDKQEEQQQLANIPPGSLADATEQPTISNPWTVVQSVPPELSEAPCKNGDVHRLDDACTSVLVCRNHRPQFVQCGTGLTYDRPSDSCRPFTTARC